MVHPNTVTITYCSSICIFRPCRSCFEILHWCDISCHKNKIKKRTWKAFAWECSAAFAAVLNVWHHRLILNVWGSSAVWWIYSALPNRNTVLIFWCTNAGFRFKFMSKEHWQSQSLFWLHCLNLLTWFCTYSANACFFCGFFCLVFLFFLVVLAPLNVQSVKIFPSVTYKHYIIAYNLCSSCQQFNVWSA